MPRTAKKIVEVIEEAQESAMSAKGAKEITAHLVAILNHPETPGDLTQAIAHAIQELFNDASGEAQAAISDHPVYIQNVPLGYGDNLEAIDAAN